MPRTVRATNDYQHRCRQWTGVEPGTCSTNSQLSMTDCKRNAYSPFICCSHNSCWLGLNVRQETTSKGTWCQLHHSNEACEEIPRESGSIHLIVWWKGIHSCSDQQLSKWPSLHTAGNQESWHCRWSPAMHSAKPVMVSVAVSKLGCTKLIFVEPGVKVNGPYFRDILLSQQMLPSIRQLAGKLFVFQQVHMPLSLSGHTRMFPTRP